MEFSIILTAMCNYLSAIKIIASMHEIDDLVPANETMQQRLLTRKTELDLCEFRNERISNGVVRTFFHAPFQ